MGGRDRRLCDESLVGRNGDLIVACSMMFEIGFVVSQIGGVRVVLDFVERFPAAGQRRVVLLQFIGALLQAPVFVAFTFSHHPSLRAI